VPRRGVWRHRAGEGVEGSCPAVGASCGGVRAAHQGRWIQYARLARGLERAAGADRSRRRRVLAGAGVDAWATEPDLGYTEFSPPFATEGKAEAVAKTEIKKLWEDTLGVCWFACWGVEGVLDRSARAVAYATGWSDFDRTEALLVGERVVNLQRVIALKRGFQPQDEYDISERLLEAPTAGKTDGKSVRPHLANLVHQYYEFMDWDPATARPTRARSTRSGLPARSGSAFTDAAGT